MLTALRVKMVEFTYSPFSFLILLFPFLFLFSVRLERWQSLTDNLPLLMVI